MITQILSRQAILSRCIRPPKVSGIVLVIAFSSLTLVGATIDTTIGRDVGVFVPKLGNDTESSQVETTLGQTFVPPDGSPYLNTASVWLWASPEFQPATFAAYLMPWNGLRASEPVLYESTLRSSAGLTPGQAWQLDFSVGVALEPGNSYVFLLSATRFMDAPTGAVGLGSVFDNYENGQIVLINNQGDFSRLTSGDWWEPVSPAYDLAFRAEFLAVPEPSTMILFALGSCALIGFAIRRK